MASFRSRQALSWKTAKDFTMPKIVDHDEYREELIVRFIPLLAEKGYSGVSMRELSEAAGVSTGTLYHYFPTKESILEQMFMFVQENNLNEYLSITESLESVPEKIDFAVKKWKEFGSFYQSIMLLATDALRNIYREKAEQIFSGFSDHYTGAISRELNISESEARSVFIYLLGIVFHSVLTPNYLSYGEQIDLLRNILERCIQLQTRGKTSEFST